MLAGCGGSKVRSATSATTTIGSSAPPVSGHHTLYFRPVLCELPSSVPSTVTPTTYPSVPPTSVPLGSSPSDTATTGPPGSYPGVPGSTATLRAAYSTLCADQNASSTPSTANGSESAAQDVIVPYYLDASSPRYVLGPADMTGSAIANAQAISEGGYYQVQLTFTAAGAAEFNAVAAQRYPYYRQNPSDPPFQSLEAIELDGKVVSAPTIQAASFNGSAVISGSTSAPFTEKQASVIAQEILLARTPS